MEPVKCIYSLRVGFMVFLVKGGGGAPHVSEVVLCVNGNCLVIVGYLMLKTVQT